MLKTVMSKSIMPETIIPKIKPGECVSDIDGNIYASVIIGNQMWTVENLRTTRLKDGTSITLLRWTEKEWTEKKEPACFYYNGVIYNWYAAASGKLAPEGWKIPEKIDWDILVRFLIENGYNYDSSTSCNKVAKSLAAKIGWPSSSIEGTPGNKCELNSTAEFSALPATTVVDQFEHICIVRKQ